MAITRTFVLDDYLKEPAQIMQHIADVAKNHKISMPKDINIYFNCSRKPDFVLSASFRNEVHYDYFHGCMSVSIPF